MLNKKGASPNMSDDRHRKSNPTLPSAAEENERSVESWMPM